jgi:SAM-dependent methyltransferase
VNNFEIIKYEFITNDYPIELKYIHWSRIYEWKYVLDKLKEIKPNSIHNTACGGLNYGDCLHLTFCNDIEQYSNNVIHSDVWGRLNYIGIEKKPEKENFIFYDILVPNSNSFDVVLNISTIEHLNGDDILLAFDNLYNQVNSGGHLILTFDYPDVNLNIINKRIDATPLNFSNRILNKNELSVVLLHIKKEE